jgi:hypothetical protein
LERLNDASEPVRVTSPGPSFDSGGPGRFTMRAIRVARLDAADDRSEIDSIRRIAPITNNLEPHLGSVLVCAVRRLLSEIAVLRGHDNWLFSAAFSPDGSRIVTASGDKARIWDAVTAKEIVLLRGHENLKRARSADPGG